MNPQAKQWIEFLDEIKEIVENNGNPNEALVRIETLYIRAVASSVLEFGEFDGPKLRNLIGNLTKLILEDVEILKEHAENREF